MYFTAVLVLLVLFLETNPQYSYVRQQFASAVNKEPNTSSAACSNLDPLTRTVLTLKLSTLLSEKKKTNKHLLWRIVEQNSFKPVWKHTMCMWAKKRRRRKHVLNEICQGHFALTKWACSVSGEWTAEMLPLRCQGLVWLWSLLFVKHEVIFCPRTRGSCLEGTHGQFPHVVHMEKRDPGKDSPVISLHLLRPDVGDWSSVSCWTLNHSDIYKIRWSFP